MESLILTLLAATWLVSSQAASPSVQDRPSCKMNAAVASSSRVNTTQRLEKLRSLMSAAGAHAYVVYSNDAHGSEYPSKYDKRRCYISGLCGSAGTAVITNSAAALWVDGRYHLKAEETLDCNWILMKQGRLGVPTIEEWLTEVLQKMNKVYVNPLMISIDDFKTMESQLDKSSIVLKTSGSPLVDEVWNADKDNKRPEIPKGPIEIHELKFAGKSWQKKLEDVRKEMKEHSADALAVTGLDEIAWLYNLRGTDVSYVPVFISYSIVTSNKVQLFLRDHDIKLKSSALRTHLNTKSDGTCTGQLGVCVEVKSYNDFFIDVGALAKDANTYKQVWLSPHSNYKLLTSIQKSQQLIVYSPIAFMKGVKNVVERKGMKNAHLKDGVAIIKFVTMLEQQVQRGVRWTELGALNELETIQRAEEYNRGPSFRFSVGSGKNGADIHYSVSNASNRAITTKEMYLQDSGGQYLDGTTDTTRTFHFGTPTDMEKEAYTRVLMGVINVATLKWPEGIEGRSIDPFARSALWSVGLIYRHGTGHGIGHFLAVHEGPASISANCRKVDAPLKEGMFFSDEPGYYEEGMFGVRLETIMMVEKVKLKYKFQDVNFLGFTPVAYVPFERHLIDVNLLNSVQLTWLNWYHEQVESVMGAELRRRKLTKEYEWMRLRTAKIVKNDSTRARLQLGVGVLVIVSAIMMV